MSRVYDVHFAGGNIRWHYLYDLAWPTSLESALYYAGSTHLEAASFIFCRLETFIYLVNWDGRIKLLFNQLIKKLNKNSIKQAINQAIN